LADKAYVLVRRGRRSYLLVNRMPEASPEESAEAAVDAAGELLAAAAALDDPVAPVPAENRAEPGPLPPGLPPHAQGLLRIGVRVAVTLASQRKSVQEIVELGPGAIIKFDKTCDEPLELCVCNHPIATGEVVKIGDKFGLRVGKVIRPEERLTAN
jgi:flagellar motor switch protein FliN/FliY